MAQLLSGFAPFTPSKSSHSSRPSSKLQDSPFSDYFTDDGHERNDSGFSAPSSATQQLLVRISKLQSQIMRGDDDRSESDIISIVEKKIGEIEQQLNSVHSQTRMPPELEDSGLFMEEEDDDDDDREAEDQSKNETPNGNESMQLPPNLENTTAALLASSITEENRKAEHDWIILEAQKVLDNVNKLEEQLSLRSAELKRFHEKYDSEMEEAQQREEKLKNENEALKSDLSFDHTELLFLKLQFKALEIDVEAIHAAARRLEEYAPEIREDIQRVRKAKIKEDMQRWEEEWEEVERRFGRRRNKYRLIRQNSAENEESENVNDAQPDDPDETEGWQLETIKEDDGKVQRITITRTDTQGHPLGTEDAAENANNPSKEADSTKTDRTTETDDQNTPSQGAQENPTYTDQSTQTDLAKTEPWLFVQNDTHLATDAEDFDCAITTSSEDNNDLDSLSDEDSEVAAEKEPQQSALKSAWQDLWEGLSSLAGMGEERF